MARFADGILHLQITLDPDWHVNSNQPLEEDLIATELAVIEGTPPTRITYPQPVERELGFFRPAAGAVRWEFCDPRRMGRAGGDPSVCGPDIAALLGSDLPAAGDLYVPSALGAHGGSELIVLIYTKYDIISLKRVETNFKYAGLTK